MLCGDGQFIGELFRKPDAVLPIDIQAVMGMLRRQVIWYQLREPIGSSMI
jgi:hypothetical protein